MNKRYVKWLDVELPEWINKGIISAQQAGQIRDYYAHLTTTGKKIKVLILCSVLGSLLIGLGIVSLIAHNWEQLGIQARTIFSLAPALIGIALTGWALFKKDSSEGLREGASTFLALMIGSSIALVCQTYNISGDVNDFTLTWMLLTIPLVYLVTATLPGVIYVIGITMWALGHVWGNTGIAFWYWPLIALCIPHFLYIIRRENFSVRAMLLASFLALSFIITGINFMVRIFPEYWIVSVPLLFALLYLTGTHKFGGAVVDWQQPLRKIGNLGVIIVSLILTYKWPWKLGSFYYDIDYRFFGTVIFIILLGSVVLLNYLSIKEKRTGDALAGIAPVIALIGYAVKPAAMISFNLYFLGFSLYRIIAGIRSNRLSAINAGLLMLAALIALRFFDSQINMVLKGLVLIALGAGFIITNSILIRRKNGGE